jgi:hypothetical protein
MAWCPVDVSTMQAPILILANKSDQATDSAAKLSHEEVHKVLQVDGGVLGDHAVHTVFTNGLNGAGLDDGLAFLRAQVLRVRTGDGEM